MLSQRKESRAAGKEFDRKLSAPLILSRILDSDDTFIAHIIKGVKKLPTPTLIRGCGAKFSRALSIFL